MVLSMDKWIDKVAIVTGASSGIGKAIVDDLVKSGLTVIGAARRVELIQQHAEELEGQRGKLHAFKCDLTKEDDIIKMIEYTTTYHGPISILVNNAGWGGTGSLFMGGKEETLKWKKVFDLNVLCLCIATREAIKDMRENGIDGHVVHINSIGGHYVPNNKVPFNVYAGSKHAVTALTETLRQELITAGSKIKVTSISPGVTESELTIQFSGKFPMLKAEDVADAVHYVLSTPEHVQVHELMIRPVGEPF